MNNVLKCGIVGYGYMGEIRHEVIEKLPQLQLVGVVESAAEKKAKLSGIPTFDCVEELFESHCDIDIMFVCTPNVYAPEIAIKSMNRGIHVFCEKPPGRTLDDIKEMRKVESLNPKVKLMFGFNHRFHPAVIKAKAIIKSGRLGKVISLRGLYGKSGGISFRNSWRNKKAISGGGILLDQGIHMLDLFRYFCGDFEAVKCFLNNSFWNLEVEDNAYVILSNRQRQNAFFHSSATLWKHTFRLEIMLEDGYMTVEGLLSKSGSYGRERLTVGKRQFEDETEAVGNPAEEITHFDRDLSWELEVKELVNCIIKDQPVVDSSSEDAFKVMEIIEKAYKDAEHDSGREDTL
ncbi:Gfo/Idh/MocA family oxidoreductase [Deltaproteobacteria bacterium TL4]